jgi:nucleoside phosphorylase/mRNA-degrading endonuclease RelE of RelBE toxin-antitoxin system
LTVLEGIRALAPSSVIMVGIAFGVDADKQRIGDILVSQQLRSYELQRYGTADDGKPTIILRGDRVTASAKLLDRFRSGVFDWPGRRGRWGKRVHFGTILSGQTLVDNVDFRDQLRELEPEAIGGEMEGVGLYTAAQTAKVDWILVKAICDWADGNKSGEKVVVSNDKVSRKISTKDRDQKNAANNAAQFIMHILQKDSFVGEDSETKEAQRPRGNSQEVVNFGERVLYTEEFLQVWRNLPPQKQQIVRQKVGLLITNPRHHSLKAHRLKRADGELWECYLIRRFPHRLLFRYQGDKILLVQMGSHRVVDRVHVTRFEGKTSMPE